eukprot:TRINITY_DN17408_c0_g1_i1.p1 TRINITY_DN17408_c0_g1~~TRINITY_DN17408_c0_g1_i1.p1  ORF type:complete len:363 (-),score=64.56 TRINITY_DN17408_c0_g1_i1:190-1191(-)
MNYEPYNRFSQSWRSRAPYLIWGLDFSYGHTQERILIPSSNISLYDEAALIRCTFAEPKLITLPLEISVIVQDPSQNVRYLFSEKIWGLRDSVWTDSGARMRLTLKEYDQTRRLLYDVMINVHAHKVLEELDAKWKPPRSTFHGIMPLSYYGLTGYSVFITLRSEENQSFKSIASIRTGTDQYFSQTESLYECSVILEVSSFPHLLDCDLEFATKTPSSLKLIADVLVFDQNGTAFLHRSGYLWLQKDPNFGYCYEASMLSVDNNWVAFNINSKENLTCLSSCKIVVPLGRINTWFKMSHRYLDIALMVLEIENDKQRLCAMQENSVAKHRLY